MLYTNLHKTKHVYTNIEHKIFKELVPSVSPLLKKHIRLGHAGKWYRGPLRRFINTRLNKTNKKSILKKEWKEAKNKKNKNIYI